MRRLVLGRRKVTRGRDSDKIITCQVAATGKRTSSHRPSLQGTGSFPKTGQEEEDVRGFPRKVACECPRRPEGPEAGWCWNRGGKLGAG